MSFTQTPLAQQRRRDHSAFVPPKQPLQLKAPLGSRSPPPTHRPGAPVFATSPPKPDRWAVKDTTVQIASALHLAAADMSYSNPNDAWASGAAAARRPAVPRSSSVEFEHSANAALANRKFPLPSRSRKPLSQNASTSLLSVPDSEPGDHHDDHDGSSRMTNGRATSPLSSILDAAKNGLAQAAIYMRQRSVDPENRSGEVDNQHGISNDSYSYNQEDREYQAKQRQRRIRMSVDNKAYKPPADEDSDGSYDDSDDDRKRIKKKLGKAGPPLTGLPSIGPEKRRKKKKTNRIGGAADEDDDQTEDRSRSRAYSQDPNEHDSTLQEMDSQEQVLDSIPEMDENDMIMDSPSVPSLQRQASQRPRSRTPAPAPAPNPAARHPSLAPSSASHSSPTFSIGNLLGRIVRLFIQFFVKVVSFIASLFYLLGTVLGTIAEMLVVRPYSWLQHTPKAAAFLRYLVPGLGLVVAWWMLQAISSSGAGTYLPSISLPFSKRPSVVPYTPHSTPPVDISELSAWLQRLEETVSQLSSDHIRDHNALETGVKSQGQLVDKIAQLEVRLAQEMKRVKDAEARAREGVLREVMGVKTDVEVLSNKVKNTPPPPPPVAPQPVVVGEAVDEETRAKVKKLEARLEGIEGTASEALDIGKRASSLVASLPTQVSQPSPSSSAWWSKLGSSSSSDPKLQLKASDGQDVIPILNTLISNAILTYSKDTLGKIDYALSSAGARVIPSLTSPTFQVSHSSSFSPISHLRALLTGAPTTFVGRPPITALHPETHPGYCWPLKGTQGQLGVLLVKPVRIREVSVDHPAKEVAVDVRSAPREMEVWGLIEGQANLEKLNSWREARKELASAVEGVDEEEDPLSPASYPSTLPAPSSASSSSPTYIRLAKFTYDIHNPSPVQTFAVFPAITDLGLDFGVVALRVVSNWGKEDLTCLYRFRVHGIGVGDELEEGELGEGGDMAGVKVPKSAEEVLDSRGQKLAADGGSSW